MNLRRMSKGFASAVIIGCSVMTSPVAMAAGTPDASTTSGQTWTVQVGQMSPDMSNMAMAFFPNSIVIDAGDTINFVGAVHTVAFPGNGPMPPIGSDTMLKPAGSHMYDGTQFTSSGLMMGNSWSLTFTKPGVYPYYCGVHPGMMGVVIVQAAGTAYPMTQDQYDQLGATEAQEDLAAAQTALTAFSVKTTPGKNGTTVYHLQADLPELMSYQFNLAPAGPGGAIGSASISMEKPGVWQISAQLSGLKAGGKYEPQLNWGISDSGKSVAGASFSNVTASAKGTATVTGVVKSLGVPQGTWVLDVKDTSGQAVSSAAIDYPSYSYERYSPASLTIHQGDTVVWTQMGANEAHTITFAPTGKKITDPTKPAGGNIYAGKGYFSSGYLMPGQSYQLTFTKAGTYHYACLIHSMLNMKAVIRVLPRN